MERCPWRDLDQPTPLAAEHIGVATVLIPLTVSRTNKASKFLLQYTAGRGAHGSGMGTTAASIGQCRHGALGLPRRPRPRSAQDPAANSISISQPLLAVTIAQGFTP